MMRLDIYIAAQNPDLSRSKARVLIEEGLVTVNGAEIIKPAYEVRENDAVLVQNSGHTWVGRGAKKLLGALENWKVDVSEKNCLDIGASTGGFTQVLLEKGAQHVTALDVGHNQLDEILRGDARVTNLEGVNIRNVTKEDIEMLPEVIVIDVSFISLQHVLPKAFELLLPGGELVALVKPQFEVGKGNTKKGIVCEKELRERALYSVTESAIELGFQDVQTMESPIVGGDGNTEYLMYAKKMHS